MDPGFLKLLDDDEDDNAHPAADVDAFLAVLKGDPGGAQAAAAAAHGTARTGNGSAQPLPQPPAALVTTGHSAVKPVPSAPASTPSGQQQLCSQLTIEQQQAYIQRLPPEQHPQLYLQQQLYRLQVIQQQRQWQRWQQKQQQQQLHQQPHQQGQQPQRVEPASGAPVPRKGQIREGISFTALMPLLQPHLPAEQGQQLAVLHQRFKRNEISREDFIRGARVIAGDHVLVQTIREMHGKQLAQQLELQRRELQQLKLREQQQQQEQPQPQSSEPQATKSQLLLPNASASVASQQQPPKEQTNVQQQNLQLQTAQPPSQTQELTVANAPQQGGINDVSSS